ncbi:methylated-DNA--[protein]-cysteine S-methyltransferase [soil metagenome]
MTLYFATLASPVGQLLLTSDGERLTGLQLDVVPSDDLIPDAKPLRSAIQQLQAYFAGELRKFDLPLNAAGTAFQRTVWKQLCKVPYGKTASYRDIAAKIANPLAVRAVGSANGRNPIAIVVPCHRIIAADGTLGGYSGGLWRKEWLLNHEGVDL